MGVARWDPDDWDAYVSKTATKSAREIFSSKLHKDLDPKTITFRESCDSSLNPLSTPIIVAVDDTGSMGVLAELLIRKGLGLMIEEILDRKPVTDPHLMCMAIGDAWFDQAPLQVTQFETDIRLADQLSDFWIEGGGGGNSYESYNLPWYFAATRTKCDAFLKRKRKGYLFTVGDEPPPPKLLAKHAREFLGASLQQDISTRDILTMVSKNWEVFHIMIAEGSYFRSQPDQTRKEWRQLLGQRAIPLSNHENLAELIVSTIEVNEGADISKTASSWSGGTALVIRESLAALSKSAGLIPSGKGVTRL
jgi:hypothetical protein